MDFTARKDIKRWYTTEKKTGFFGATALPTGVKELIIAAVAEELQHPSSCCPSLAVKFAVKALHLPPHIWS